MAPHEFVESQLVRKADYFDPQLKTKLHEIRDSLRRLLHTDRRQFILEKMQPWNSIKVTFDIPKESADRLRLLAVQGNVHLIEHGITSVEIVGQSNAIVIDSTKNPPITTSKLPAPSSLAPTPIPTSPSETELAAYRSKHVTTNFHQPNTNPMLVPPTPLNHLNTTRHYLPQQVIHRPGQVLHAPHSMNSGVRLANVHHSTLVNSHHLQDSWSDYKMKINGMHYYPSVQTQYEMRRCDTHIPSQCPNPTTTNSLDP